MRLARRSSPRAASERAILATATTVSREEGERHPALVFLAAAWSWLFLALLLVFFETWARLAYGISFLVNPYNLQSIAQSAALPLLLGLGQTFVIIAGGIDLSVGFVMGLSSVVMARTMQQLTPIDPALALVAGLLCAVLAALAAGFINGTLVSRLQVPPFIGTLGMYGVARGVGFLAGERDDGAGQQPVSVHDGQRQAAGRAGPGRAHAGHRAGDALGALPEPVRAVHLRGRRQPHRHRARRHRRAAAYAAALHGGRGLAGVAGMIYTARFSAGAAQGGEPLLLDSIAAVVIGGASLFGGSGTIMGTVIGALIIAVIQYGLVFIDVEPFWQFVAVGVVIIVSVLIDQSRRRLAGGRAAEEG